MKDHEGKAGADAEKAAGAKEAAREAAKEAKAHAGSAKEHAGTAKEHAVAAKETAKETAKEAAKEAKEAAKETAKEVAKEVAKEAKETAKSANPANIVVRAEWARIRLWQIQLVRDVTAIAMVVGILWLGYELSIVTVPLLLAVFLAYLLEPLVKRALRSGRFSRQGVATGFIAAVAILIVVPVMIGIAVAVVQGVGYATEMAKNVTALVQSVDDSTNMQKRAKVSARGPVWVRLRDYIVTQDAKYRQSEPNRPEDSAAPEGVTPETMPEAPAKGDGAPAKAEVAASTGSSQPDGALATLPGSKPLEVHPDDKQIAKEDDPLEKPAKTVAEIEAEEKARQLAEKNGGSASAEPPPLAAAPSGEGGRLLAIEEAGYVSPGERPSDLYVLLRRGVEWGRDNLEAFSERALKASGGVAGFIAGFATGTAGRVGGLLFGAFLTAFFFFFICTGWGRVLRFWQSLIPERKQNRVFNLVGMMDEVIAGFVRGRITICGILMVYYTIAFWIVGVPAWLLMGPLMGALVLIPYAQVLGYFVAIVLMALQPAEGFQGTWWWILGAPLVLVTFGQFMDDYILTPKIQGKSTNMDTPTILFASVAGGALAGFYGLLVAIPVAACLKILLREVFWPRFKAWAEGRERDFLPLER